MNHADRLALHEVLTRIADRLDAIEALQRLMANSLTETETDIKNIFHVLEETQAQQRRGSDPKLKAVARHDP